MKHFILCISMTFSFLGCAQNSKNMEEVNELLGNLYKEVQYQNKAINYHADIFIGGCNFEVLINDFPVHSYYGDGRGAVSTSIPINTAILGPGKQTWKIRIYPVRKVWEEDDVPFMTIEESISKGARAEISIEGVRYDNEGGIEKSFGKVVDFEAPLIVDSVSNRKILGDAGMPYVEYSGVFEAKVPYQLKGWSEGQDLTKMDKDELLEKVLKAYHKHGSIIEKGQLNEAAKEEFMKVKENSQALFFTKEDNEEYLETFVESRGHKNIEVMPFEYYELKIYGAGKIVTLIDSFDGKSAFFGSSYDGEEEGYSHYIFYFYFYLPEGESELKIIR